MMVLFLYTLIDPWEDLKSTIEALVGLFITVVIGQEFHLFIFFVIWQA